MAQALSPGIALFSGTVPGKAQDSSSTWNAATIRLIKTAILFYANAWKEASYVDVYISLPKPNWIL